MVFAHARLLSLEDTYSWCSLHHNTFPRNLMAHFLTSLLSVQFWFFSLLFLMSQVNGLSILFIFSKNQHLILLIFAIVSFIFFFKISMWIALLQELSLLCFLKSTDHVEVLLPKDTLKGHSFKQQSLVTCQPNVQCALDYPQLTH